MQEEEITDLDFECWKEPWNKYEIIPDGTILRARTMLTRVRKRTTKDGKISYNCELHSITRVFRVPSRLRGQPSPPYTPEELKSSIVENDLRYNVLFEEWSEYLVEDGAKIRIKPTITRIARTSKYDKNGDPIYITETSGLAQIKPPSGK